jgi:Zn-finger nucleic acid-binding protein
MAREHICPKCKDYSTLLKKTVDDGETTLHLETCSACHGAWLEWDELGPAKALRALLPTRPMSVSVQRDHQTGICPACDPSHALDRVPVGAFAIDRCPDCEGMWFDGGELGPMLTDQGFAALLKALRDSPAGVPSR